MADKEKETIIFDVDGCLIEENSIFEFILRLFRLRRKKPNQRMVKLLKYFLRKNYDIIALSNRPRIFGPITRKQLLTRYGRIFKKVICTGGVLTIQRAERKRKVIERENGSIVFDNNPQILDYLYSFGIQTFDINKAVL